MTTVPLPDLCRHLRARLGELYKLDPTAWHRLRLRHGPALAWLQEMEAYPTNARVSGVRADLEALAADLDRVEHPLEASRP
jgi:hypothetical protein